MCVHMVNVWLSGDNLRDQSLSSTLFDAGAFFVLHCIHQTSCLTRFQNPPASTSHFILGALGLQKTVLLCLALCRFRGFEVWSWCLHSKFFIHWSVYSVLNTATFLYTYIFECIWSWKSSLLFASWTAPLNLRGWLHDFWMHFYMYSIFRILEFSLLAH